jgi:hypothetical protein
MPYADPAKQAEYQRAWMAKRRVAWIEASGPCVDCGSWENPEVDHVDASTKVEHRVWSWAAPRREAELAKCVVRCTDCHKQKSAGEKNNAGEDNPMAKLTEEGVRLIRSSSRSLRDLADELGVDYSLVGQVRRGQIWKHI